MYRDFTRGAPCSRGFLFQDWSRERYRKKAELFHFNIYLIACVCRPVLFNSPVTSSASMAVNCETCTLSAFTLNRKLGEGGFGCTYYARRKSDGLEVCLKMIRLKNGISQRQIAREATVLSELNDPHVIHYYGSFAESNVLFIMMEYAQEGSLKDLINV